MHCGTHSQTMPSTPFGESTVNLTVLISGNGSNLQALIDATTSLRSNSARAHIIHVISNRRNAYGLTRARNARIPTTLHNLISDG